MTSDRQRLVENTLRAAFEPTELLVRDQSHLHIGHPGAGDGRGHFDIKITAPAFSGASRIQRHRMVYDALGDLLETDIHALKIRAFSPGESQSG
ncbi:MAG: BolA family protein [Woeseiaceae bacterium]|nr:BolA family protein [Woeseiaceae bacterium]